MREGGEEKDLLPPLPYMLTCKDGENSLNEWRMGHRSHCVEQRESELTGRLSSLTWESSKPVAATLSSVPAALPWYLGHSSASSFFFSVTLLSHCHPSIPPHHQYHFHPGKPELLDKCEIMSPSQKAWSH